MYNPSSGEPTADYFQQDEFYGSNAVQQQPPPFPLPPPSLVQHPNPLPLPPSVYCQPPNYDFAYCKTEWMYYDSAQQCGQYEAAYCSYSFSNMQSSDPSNTLPPNLPPLTPPLTRHQHQLQIQQLQEGGASSSSAILNSIGPKPSQSESRMPGRHPHPPTGNNSKLKHKCPFDGCPWKFATPYKLRRHIKSHTKETPFVCKECGRGFSVRYNLLMHIQTIHSQPQKFKCPMQGCKEAFHTQPRLNGHLRRVHKKDWKTLQPPKSDVEAKQGGGGGGEGGGVSSRSSSTSSDDSLESAPKTQRFQCVQCPSAFSSQAKLTAHFKTHASPSASDKSFKCTIPGCSKSFPSKDKLGKHVDIHKQTKQYCCPHENCNRVFLRQSHLKNHLKIHAHDYFVCPVMDCSERFASEADYNIHLNSHMNYRHKCHMAGCGHAFLTRKRLELHCRVMHGLELHGLQPVLPVQLGHTSPPLVPHSQHSPPPHHAPILTAGTCPLSHNGGGGGGSLLTVEDGIREVDLPGLSADEIETILSENSHWSGEQFKNFFHSAVELSELEAKLFSGSGYESDSGYSTYDVSPITSSAPLQFGGCHPDVPTSYRSISPALTPVNPSPYISLSSSNPFHFGHTSMHTMSLHSSGGSATTPLPHSASPDAEFTFFPPATPSYHHHHPPPPLPTPLTPTQETAAAAYMMQGPPPPPPPPPHAAFPQMQAPSTPQPHQGDYQMQYPPILPQQQQQQQQQQQEEAYGIEFADILGEPRVVVKAPMAQCNGGEMQGQQQQMLSLPPPLILHQNPGKVKPEMENKSCMNPIEGTSSSTIPMPTMTSPVMSYPAPVKNEAVSEGNIPSCQMSAHLPPTPTLQSDQASPTPQATATTSSKQLKAFLATCSKLAGLQELVSSGVHPSVIVVTVSTALAAITTNQLAHKLTVREGPYDIPRLHLLVSSLSPQQQEKLGDPTLIATAQRLATQHLEGLARARKRVKTSSKPSSVQPNSQLANANIVVQSKTSVKASITVKTFSKHRSSGRGVGGLASDMKAGHKKKTQWPRSMSKANLMAFREHILNKLKRGKEEGARSGESQEASSLATAMTNSPSFEVDAGCSSGEVPVQARCSSEPADFFSHHMHDSSSPSSLQASQSAANISCVRSLNPKHLDSDCTAADSSLNPDILLSSSVLGLPDNILADMEMDSLASPSEQDFSLFLCDPSPPSSVTSPLESMEDLDSIQDFLSGAPDNNTLSSAHFSGESSSDTVIISSTHTASFPPTHSPSYTTAATPVTPSGQSAPFPVPACTQSTAATEESTPPVCSMADVASLFNESINSIANVVESVPKLTTTAVVAAAAGTAGENLESVFQRPTDPLLACGSRLHW